MCKHLRARTGSANDLDAWVPELDERAAQQHSEAAALLFKWLAVMDQRCTAQLKYHALRERGAHG